jgi:hypothetical protein
MLSAVRLQALYTDYLQASFEFLITWPECVVSRKCCDSLVTICMYANIMHGKIHMDKASLHQDHLSYVLETIHNIENVYMT